MISAARGAYIRRFVLGAPLGAAIVAIASCGVDVAITPEPGEGDASLDGTTASDGPSGESRGPTDGGPTGRLLVI